MPYRGAADLFPQIRKSSGFNAEMRGKPSENRDQFRTFHRASERSPGPDPVKTKMRVKSFFVKQAWI